MQSRIKVGDLVEIRNVLGSINPKTGKVDSISTQVGFVTALDDFVCKVISGGKSETFVLGSWFIRKIDNES